MVDYVEVARRTLAAMQGQRVSRAQTEPEPVASACTPAPSHTGVDYDQRGISWAEWKAAALNRLFQEQGLTGQLGNIKAATVRHGLRQSGESMLDKHRPRL